jgi:hypothetical protein
MDVREIGRSGMDWIDLGQDREQWRSLAKKSDESLDSIKML